MFTKNIIVFLMENFISTNRKGETKLSSLPIGRNKIKKNNNILCEIIVSLFTCFVNPFPKKNLILKQHLFVEMSNSEACVPLPKT